MRKSIFFATPVVALGLLGMSAGPAIAHNGGDHGGDHGAEHSESYTAEDSWSFEASLDSMNNSGTTGDVMVHVEGNEATVTMNVEGAAETFMDGPFPHAQHIHFGAQGVCPPPEADQDGDGAVNVEEGHPFYGAIGTSLTTEGDTSPDSGLAVDRFPGGSSYTYERTVEVPDDVLASMADGTGVIVVHGVDPANLSEQAQNAQSELDPELPLAATLPAACGTLNASQMTEMPDGGADTGVGTSTDNGTGVALGVGGGLLAAAALGGGAFAVRRAVKA